MVQDEEYKLMELGEKFDSSHPFMKDDMEQFRQIDYLWLFNNELKFDER